MKKKCNCEAPKHPDGCITDMKITPLSEYPGSWAHDIPLKEEPIENLITENKVEIQPIRDCFFLVEVEGTFYKVIGSDGDKLIIEDKPFNFDNKGTKLPD
jgi:hypothetical protein